MDYYIWRCWVSPYQGTGCNYSTRHKTFATIKTGVKKDGTLTARFIKVIMNGGAYTSWSRDAPGVLASTAMPVYRCPNSMFEGWTVYTNRTVSATLSKNQ